MAEQRNYNNLKQEIRAKSHKAFNSIEMDENTRKMFVVQGRQSAREELKKSLSK